jgi:NADH:ubiquinone oxidoreductase subunit H
MHSTTSLVLGSSGSIACGTWLVWCTYLLVVCLETSIHPYDVLEAEPEVVSGYYVDYGGVVFMLLYLTEGVILHVCSKCYAMYSTSLHP